jgi:hypothetical protein
MVLHVQKGFAERKFDAKRSFFKFEFPAPSHDNSTKKGAANLAHPL